MKNTLKIAIFTALTLAPVAAAKAQIVFNTGSSDAFSLEYVNSGNGDDQLASVVATGSGVSSSLTGTDLSNYATLTGGAEAVGYGDGSTSLGAPNYGGGVNTVTATFNLEAATGSTFQNLTFNPYGVVITDASQGPSVSAAISVNGGAFQTFYTSTTDNSGPGAIDLSSYLTSGTATDVQIEESDVIADESYNGLFNRAAGNDQGINLAITADVVSAADVPEPSTYALMALGFGALVFVARRRLTV